MALDASTNALTDPNPDAVPEQVEAATEAEVVRKKFDYQALLDNQTFRMSLLALACYVFFFFPFIKNLMKEWLDMDGYYAHGMLIPLCAGYLVYDKWDRIKDTPVKPFYAAVVPFLLVVGAMAISSRLNQPLIQSVLFVLGLGAIVWFVAGGKWLLHTLPSILFLILGFPILDRVIDNTTLPMQQMSTQVAFALLQLTGFNPIYGDTTTIHLNNFDLFVAVACSGLKTTIAVCAAVIFFMMIARLKFFANLILASVAVPLSIIINGIRIAMIGMVGDINGHDAGMQFHDYSGYIALILCFFVLFKLSRVLGYK